VKTTRDHLILIVGDIDCTLFQFLNYGKLLLLQVKVIDE